jgi:photosystem II stability/assembly factor-like uncharacterized protein
MEHVHGLGVDPADSQLYAATHFGVFAVESGGARRVSGRRDVMGFAVAGPGTFLSSGHPDLAEDDEPLVGLIESRDAGRSWSTLSLRGEADFHALQVVSGRVWGYDSTSSTLMVTDDGRTWDQRSRLPLVDFAVSASNPDVVVATTESGPLRSHDGGRTWQPLAGAPPLLVVDAALGTMVGVDGTGVVHTSTDGGARWQPGGDVGDTPVAVSAGPADGDVHVATQDGRILVSRDGGSSFTTAYQP